MNISTTSPSPQPGGFLPPTPSSLINSPPTTPAVPSYISLLPARRAHPLRPGSNKETIFIQYVDKEILDVSRKFLKKFSHAHLSRSTGDYGSSVPVVVAAGSNGSIESRTVGGNDDDNYDDDEEVRGYESFPELAADMKRIVDIVWVSNTPSLQTQYLLALLSNLATYLPSFPAAPRETFRLLKAFDAAFSELVRGTKVGGTERVRLGSLVWRVRAVVGRLVGGATGVEEVEESETEGGESAMEMSVDEDDRDDYGEGEEEEGWEVNVARVFEETIEALGVGVGGGPDGPG